jgi:hypothetical protein
MNDGVGVNIDQSISGAAPSRPDREAWRWSKAIGDEATR